MTQGYQARLGQVVWDSEGVGKVNALSVDIVEDCTLMIFFTRIIIFMELDHPTLINRPPPIAFLGLRKVLEKVWKSVQSTEEKFVGLVIIVIGNFIVGNVERRSYHRPKLLLSERFEIHWKKLPGWSNYKAIFLSGIIHILKPNGFPYKWNGLFKNFGIIFIDFSLLNT